MPSTKDDTSTGSPAKAALRTNDTTLSGRRGNSAFRDNPFATSGSADRASKKARGEDLPMFLLAPEDSIEENAGATDHTGGENPADFWGEEEKGLSSRASSPDRRKAVSNPPATWLERFSPSFLSMEAILADLDRNTTANTAPPMTTPHRRYGHRQRFQRRCLQLLATAKRSSPIWHAKCATFDTPISFRQAYI